MFDDDLAVVLASGLHFEWGDDARELLAPLIDATIMRADDKQIAPPIAGTLWDCLYPLLVDELQEQAPRDAFVADALDDAIADLELGATRSRLAVAVVRRAALDLADEAFFLEECLDCIEDGLGHAPPPVRPALVDRAAAVLALQGDPEFGARPPTNSRRRAARERVRVLAELGRQGLPRLSEALLALVEEPLPPLEDDRLVRAVLQRRLAADAHLN